MAPSFDVLIEDKTKPIYVLNTTDPKALVALNIKDVSGNPLYGEFPKTWIPICITDMFPRRVLRDNHDIRTFLNKGILTLMSPKKAKTILSGTAAKQEKNRILSSKLAEKKSGYSKQATSLREAKKDVVRMEAEANAFANTKEESTSGKVVKDNVVDLCNRVIQESTTIPEAMQEFRTLGDTLLRIDLEYIIATVTNDTIKNFAKEELAKVVNNENIFDGGKSLENEVSNSPQTESNTTNDEEDSWEEEEED